MGSDDEYLGMVSINHTGVGNLIQDSDTGGSSLWVLYVGDEPPYGPGPGEVPE